MTGIEQFIIIGGFGAVILFVMSLKLIYGKKNKKGRKCRACDKRGVMAITYGEDEGLCKSCLDEYLPYALRKD